MATWPWISRFEWQTVDLNKYPNVLRWYKAIAARPAVREGLSRTRQATRHSDAGLRHRATRSEGFTWQSKAASQA